VARRARAGEELRVVRGRSEWDSLGLLEKASVNGFNLCRMINHGGVAMGCKVSSKIATGSRR
jgi:hypothetical protein